MAGSEFIQSLESRSMFAANAGVSVDPGKLHVELTAAIQVDYKNLASHKQQADQTLAADKKAVDAVQKTVDAKVQKLQAQLAAAEAKVKTHQTAIKQMTDRYQKALAEDVQKLKSVRTAGAKAAVQLEMAKEKVAFNLMLAKEQTLLKLDSVTPANLRKAMAVATKDPSLTAAKSKLAADTKRYAEALNTDQAKLAEHLKALKAAQ